MDLNKQFYKQLDLLAKDIQYATDRALYGISKDIYENRIKDSKEKKSGKEYKLYRNGKFYKYHIASKKNQEGDASISGKLNRDTNFKVSKGISNIGVNKSNKYADFIQKTRQSIVRAGKPEIEANLKTRIDKEIDIILSKNGYNK